ncbi:MAG: DUF3577 domain-containing protein [Neisseriaceae bacterium]|nr:DUF3577 domain-containing protein [Neisseriaceae bacterium]MBR3425892.1 DUF3577 domain-containing protein [Neisseriaceae bacterium]
MQTQTFFNLTVDGCGFLNRPRIVQSKGKNGSYFSATIQAKRGDSGETTRFEIRVVGGEAKSLFQKLLDEYPALLDKDYKKHPSVFVSFRIGDIQPMSFENKQTGKPVLYIDGRLLKFKSITVNKEKWYAENTQATTNAQAPTEQPVAQAA